MEIRERQLAVTQRINDLERLVLVYPMHHVVSGSDQTTGKQTPTDPESLYQTPTVSRTEQESTNDD